MIPYYILYFAIYSVFGWLYETVLCSLEARKAVNRGFLCGPYCPIYGCGAMLFLLFLGKESSLILIFIFGALIASAVEYSTSVVMEKLFDARWWDYSKFRFNLDGRICLGASMIFGAFSLLLIKYLHPYTVNIILRIPKVIVIALAAAFTVSFILDLFFTLRGFGGFGKEFAVGGELSRQEHRIVNAFPALRPTDESIVIPKAENNRLKSNKNQKTS